VRLILGLDEETGWIGMERYLAKAGPPDLGFTPDARFPVIHGEMGILTFELAKKIGKSRAVKGLELRRLGGGNAANMVPDYARALVRGDSYEAVREKSAAFMEETGFALNIRNVGKNLEITARGVSAHGSTPEKGLNAISVLAAFLARIGLVNESLLEFLDFYNSRIGFELHGEGIGCDCSDAVSGRLIFNAGVIRSDSGAVIVTVNVRYPITMDQDQIYEAMLPVIHAHNLGLVKLDHKAPVFVPEDDPLVETLMGIYRAHSGDMGGPVVIGGGTYARTAKNLVAFGPVFPGEPELAHQKDEYIDVERFIQLAKIYAEAIYKLASM
jgi:succinyl-diaminopimelate desuccinylase